MMIADAQVHIWAANTPERPCAGRRRRLSGRDKVLIMGRALGDWLGWPVR